MHITRGSGGGWARVSNVPSIPLLPLSLILNLTIGCMQCVGIKVVPARSLSSKSFSHHDFLPDLCLCGGKTLALLGLSPRSEVRLTILTLDGAEAVH